MTGIIQQGDAGVDVQAYALQHLMSFTVASRRLLTARPGTRLLVDAGIAVLSFGASLALLASGGDAPHRSGLRELDLLSVAVLGGSTLPLAFWRWSPSAMFVVTATAGVLLAVLRAPFALLLGPAVALYLFAAARDSSTSSSRPTAAMVLGLLSVYIGAAALAQQTFPGSELLHTGLAWGVAWFAGERTRLRHEQVAEFRERALRAEREAERERLLAVAEERARIARNLHDAAGHAINVIAVRAGAARLRHSHEPGRSLLALEAIEEIARHTAGEIDRMVGSLRDSETTDSPAVDSPAGLVSLDTLIARLREAGLAIVVETSGTTRQLSATTDQAAYRILQEALTNAARHGAGSARITLTFEAGSLEITVTNPLSTGQASSLKGHGLIGMRERATLVGGTFDARASGGMFRIHVRFPDRGHAA